MLAVVWLGMVFQPCLMAADVGDHCPHCPTPMTEGCGGGVSEGCTYIDRVDYDGRVPYIKLTDETPDENPVLFAALAEEIPLPKNPCATGPPVGTRPDLHAPPLNVLFCVYLN